MNERIQDAPHGLNLVIETKSGRVIIGRFDSADPFEVRMHDCDVYEPQSGTDSEPYIRETATYGVDVKQRDFSFPAAEVVRWRRLGEIQKLV
jgi:hypothetical protein